MVQMANPVDRMVQLAKGSAAMTSPTGVENIETKSFLAQARSKHSPGMAMLSFILRKEKTSDCAA